MVKLWGGAVLGGVDQSGLVGVGSVIKTHLPLSLSLSSLSQESLSNLTYSLNSNAPSHKRLSLLNFAFRLIFSPAKPKHPSVPSRNAIELGQSVAVRSDDIDPERRNNHGPVERLVGHGRFGPIGVGRESGAPDDTLDVRGSPHRLHRHAPLAALGQPEVCQVLGFSQAVGCEDGGARS